MSHNLVLKNVKLETGEVLIENEPVKTETSLFNIEIGNGKILSIQNSSEQINNSKHIIDLKGRLAIPTFHEMHNHLDKTYMTLNWKAAKQVKSLKDRLRLEAIEAKELVNTVKDRARELIQHLLSKGVTHIRTHVNIDQYVGLQHLEQVREALELFKDKITYDIVAFPQHGLLNNNVINHMYDAMRHGATMVGGLDPAGIENNIEKTLYMTMDLASEFNVDVDIHLHDGGHLGYYTIDKWIDIVEDANYKDRTAISHAFCLGDVPIPLQEKIAERLKSQGVAIMSTIPLNGERTLPPIDLLDKYGVNVHFGCDGFYDSWSPHGTGDLLEKVTRYSEMYRRIDEKSLRDGLKWITGGVTPLDKDGNQIWPKINDNANFLFIEAESSAQIVARKPEDRKVMSKGNFIN